MANAARLRNDYNKINELSLSSDVFDFEILDGSNPPVIYPERYLFIFTCKGISGIDDRENPIYSNLHKVEIYLHERYPSQQPQLQWRVKETPIWHPNINHKNGGVCIGRYAAAKFLDDVAVQIAEMIQYKNYNPDDFLVYEPADWAKEHEYLFPVDGTPIISEEIIVEVGPIESTTIDDVEVEILDDITENEEEEIVVEIVD